ncbi:hypothetical protein Tco_1104291 [Tanacetum coccineum]
MPTRRTRNINDVYERIMARMDERLDQFVDQFSNRMNDMINLRRCGDRNGRRSEDKELGNPFFEGDCSSSNELGDHGVAGDNYEGAPVFDDGYEEAPIFDDDKLPLKEEKPYDLLACTTAATLIALVLRLAVVDPSNYTIRSVVRDMSRQLQMFYQRLDTEKFVYVHGQSKIKHKIDTAVTRIFFGENSAKNYNLSTLPFEILADRGNELGREEVSGDDSWSRRKFPENDFEVLTVQEEKHHPH